MTKITSTQMSADLAALAERLRTQDNHITSDPIFYCQQKVRQFGEGECGDPYMWMDHDWNEVDDDLAKTLDEYEEDFNTEALKGYTKQYYRDVYQNVQPFFSMEGAKHYIASNGHNLKEARVYVDSAYRNYEWQLIREFLLNYQTKDIS